MSDALKAIGEFLNYVLHPYQSLMMFVNWIMGYVPAVACILLIFFAVTNSHKIIQVLGLLIVIYVLITISFATHTEGLILIVLIAVFLLKFLGGGI